MLIRLISDVHLEFGSFDLPEMVDDSKTVLVIAGDLGTADQAIRFISLVAPRFRHVVYILGNHEYYGRCMPTVEAEVYKAMQKIPNVSFLMNDSVVVDDVAFVGGTMWTDFRNDVGAAAVATLQINDFRVIYKDEERKTTLRPSDAMYMYQKSIEYIMPELARHKEEGRKTVMVVHFCVSDQSIHPRYNGSALNYYFTPNVEPHIARVQPDLVLHGHTHDPFKYNIGDTRVFCNPRGYVGYEHGNGFDPCLLINL